jgi:hypothetical protein
VQAINGPFRPVIVRFSKPLNVELLKNDVGFRRCYFWAATEVDGNEVPKLRYISGSHTRKEVLASGDKADILHFSHGRQSLCERMNDISGIDL